MQLAQGTRATLAQADFRASLAQHQRKRTLKCKHCSEKGTHSTYTCCGTHRRHAFVFIGRKSNSQNQVRNEVLKEEIKKTRFEHEQQIFNIDLNDFQDFSPEGQNTKGGRPMFENKFSAYLKEQILRTKTGDVDFSDDSIGSFLHPDEFEHLGAQPEFADHFLE